MRREKRQDRLVEFACPYLIEGMPATRENLDFRVGNQPRQLLREIGRRHDVVFGTDHQRGSRDLAETLGSVKGQDRVDSARGDIDRRGQWEVLGLGVGRPPLLLRSPPPWIE